MKHVYPNNVYEIRETHLDKLDSFGFKYMGQQNLFRNFATFDFESISSQEETFRDAETEHG